MPRGAHLEVREVLTSASKKPVSFVGRIYAKASFLCSSIQEGRSCSMAAAMAVSRTADKRGGRKKERKKERKKTRGRARWQSYARCTRTGPPHEGHFPTQLRPFPNHSVEAAGLRTVVPKTSFTPLYPQQALQIGRGFTTCIAFLEISASRQVECQGQMARWYED